MRALAGSVMDQYYLSMKLQSPTADKQENGKRRNKGNNKNKTNSDPDDLVCNPGAMLLSIRKKHWLVLSISITGVLLLLVFNVKPPALRPARYVTGNAEIGFLRRRIANDDGEATGHGAPPPPQLHLHPPVHHASSETQKDSAPGTASSSVHLSAKERVDYAKQGILLVENELGRKDSQKQSQNKEPETDQGLGVPQEQQAQHANGKQDWQKKIMLQRLEIQKQQSLLREHHIREQQLLQQRLKQQQVETDAVQQQLGGVAPIQHQSSSVSVVSKTAQVSQASSGTDTFNGPSAPRKPSPVASNSYYYPHMTYESLKNMGERILRHTVRKEFLDAVKDTDFKPGEVVSPSQVRRVIILSTWRSGSTFLGDLLRSYPGAFFSFEPLHHLLKNLHLQEGPLVEVVTNLIRNILTCDYSDLDEYVNYMRNNTFLLDHNTRLWNSCARNRALCFDKDYISNMCKYMPVNVMKTVRMGLSPVVELLQDPSLDLRVIHLVRDPRGSLHSRMQLSWCKSMACSDPETVCSDLLTDLKLSATAKEKFPDRYLFVRYEDLSLEPEKKAREIMSFLNLTYQKSVSAFVRDHTSLARRSMKKPGTYSTYRDSKATTFAWRGALNYTTVESIQEVCKESLEILKLRYFDTEEDYMNTTIPVLDE
ncbi:uncharacterized protein LOC135212179 isoform X1 [Macrobrachium nipponense]|uniref:uncharacterized protein LOC135212179 isoform X1 n=2 Tax=Macrobrachium nipponense TaxID=159736 RepID=UPI0030C8141B